MSWTTTALRRSFFINLLVMLSAVLLLQACGGGKKAPPPAPVVINPTGYYTNTGTLTVQSVPRTDLQAMINGTRFIMMSVQAGLIYDGSITITGNTFTGAIMVFTNGINPSPTTVTGTIAQGSGITGTLTGTGAGNGTFSLNYTAASNLVANVARINASTGNPTWTSFIGGSTSNLEFTLGIANTPISGNNEPQDGNFKSCGITGTDVIGDPGIIPLPGTSLYSVHVKMNTCNPNTAANTVTRDPLTGLDVVTAGDYTGLAASRSQSTTDDTLVLVFTSANGAFSVGGDFK